MTMEFDLPASIRKKGKWFISSCRALDVHSQGRTRQEAEHNLVDALASFLVSCYERGTLDTVLKESGFVPASEREASRKATPRGSVPLRVPVPFVIPGGRVRAAAS